MAAYAGLVVLGTRLYQWMESADGACPVKPCTLSITDFDHEIFDDDATLPQMHALSIESSEMSGSDDEDDDGEAGEDWGENAPYGPYDNAWTHVGRMNDLFDVDLLRSDDRHWNVTKYVEKSEGTEYTFPPETREAQYEEAMESIIPPLPTTVSWSGVVSRKAIVLNMLKRNYEQPYMNEVTNAIYSHVITDPALKYVFVHDVKNDNTYSFITEVLFPTKGWRYPGDQDGRRMFNYTDQKDDFLALLGTEIGRTVAYLVLGRYPRGTCKMNQIGISISGIKEGIRPTIDMMFEFTPTQPAYTPEEAKAAAGDGKAGPDPAAVAGAGALAALGGLAGAAVGGLAGDAIGGLAGAALEGFAAAVPPPAAPAGPVAAPLPGAPAPAPAAVPKPPAAPVPPPAPLAGPPPAPVAAPPPAAPAPPPAPVPPPGGKPLGLAIAAAAPDRKKIMRDNRRAILKRKAQEREDEENDKIEYGKTRRGKKFKKE